MQTLAVLTLLAAFGQANASSCTCAHCLEKALPARAVATKTTEHFVIRSSSPSVDAAELATHAEAMRATLVTTWLGEQANSDWTPRCEIIVHAQRASYLKAIGSGGSTTLGSTLIRYSEGKIAVRRIDLLADRANRPFETVAHELVHVIFAERFPNSPPPRWAEEGAALLADTQAKRTAHQREFKQALRGGTAFRVHDLVRMSDYPPPTRFAAFYGQSLALVEFLTQLGEPRDFVRFVDRSIEAGHDKALAEIYDISSAQELELLWNERAVKAVLAAN